MMRNSRCHTVLSRIIRPCRFGLVLLTLCCSSPLVSAADDPAVDSTVTAVKQLAAWLDKNELSPKSLQELAGQTFATAPLSREDSKRAAKILWSSRVDVLKQERDTEFRNRELRSGDLVMPFWYTTFGEKPEGGHSLFISMHGGGGTTAQVNDRQYENQKRLYKPKEGIYLVPRAPTNTWNLWHQGHIDAFFDRLITDMIIFEDVNPDRVYLMGYSAGGDGVYQLAPRMADRLAAAAMMAGHPNETRPDGLRNIGFTLHVGERDGGYNRNRIAVEWKEKLAALQKSDPSGYAHHVQIHPGRGHWMNLEDAVAVPWMAKFTRQRYPKRVVWLQDDVRHTRFYWLRVNAADIPDRTRIVASVRENSVTLEQADVAQLTLLLHDDLIDMDQPVTVLHGDSITFQGRVQRTIGAIARSLLERDDPRMVACAELTVRQKAE